jgi:glutathione S-transferase
MSDLTVYTFSPAWGLPTSGPFSLKLLAWLNLNGIPYRQVIENNAAKGPQGKSPWIEDATGRLGDSDAIVEHLSSGIEDKAPDAGGPCAHFAKTTFEERFHQVLEYELMVHPAGIEGFDRLVRTEAPRLGGVISTVARRHFRRQLHARGLTRRTTTQIAALGRSDIDALESLLGERPFLGGEVLSRADLAVFGQVAPMLNWPMETPVAQYARTRPAISRWHAAIRDACTI